MLLTELTNKPVFSGKNPRGVCLGVGISLKSHAVKYLLCASETSTEVNFTLSTDAVAHIDERITLTHARPLYPKSCARIFIGKSVYANDGSYLGKVLDLECDHFVATRLYTDQNAVYPVSAISACQDVVIMKKEAPFPLGQRIPAPFLSLLTDKKDGVLTKPLLKVAIEKGALIGLTLSLPPFSLENYF